MFSFRRQKRGESFSDAQTVMLARRKPSRQKRRASGVPSGPWAFALILLGGSVAFIAAAIAFEERESSAPSRRDAAAETRSISLPVASTR
jgi:hypothetical protein